MELLKRVTVKIDKGIDRLIIAKQNDTARYLLFNIIEDNGVPFSLQGKEVKIFVVKPDSKLIYNTCSITDINKGKVKVNLTSQTLAVPGVVNAELVISEGNNILSTIPFEIEVIKSLRNDSAIESTNEFTVLFSKIKEGQTLEASISELIKVGTPLYNKLKPVVEGGKPLSTDLPPKVNEAKSIYQQLLQAMQSGNLNNYMLKKYLDTRSDNQNPEWYFENYPNQTINEFKHSNTIGIMVADNPYGVLETKNPWGDSSGGYPVQTFKSNSTETYQRHGISNTEWSAWEKVYTSGNKPTPSEIGATPISSGAGDNLNLHPYNDLNLLDKTCFGYSVSSASGKPPGEDHALMQMAYNSIWKTQLAHDWRTNKLYIRVKNNGAWSNWAEMYTTATKPTPADIGAAKAPSKEKLWRGSGWVLTSRHKATLSKNIKDTPNGLILRWVAYTGGVIRDYHYAEVIISNDEDLFGKSRSLTMVDTAGNAINKTVYVTDGGMALIGHDSNDTGNNRGMVLVAIKEF